MMGNFTKPLEDLFFIFQILVRTQGIQSYDLTSVNEDLGK